MSQKTRQSMFNHHFCKSESILKILLPEISEETSYVQQ